MKLESNVKTYVEVEYGDLERFATEIYDLDDYNFACVQECGNDTSTTFNVHGKLGRWDIKTAKKIVEEKRVPSWSNGILLNLLCADGHIIPGEYLIHVSW